MRRASALSQKSTKENKIQVNPSMMKQHQADGIAAQNPTNAQFSQQKKSSNKKRAPFQNVSNSNKESLSVNTALLAASLAHNANF